MKTAAQVCKAIERKRKSDRKKYFAEIVKSITLMVQKDLGESYLRFYILEDKPASEIVSQLVDDYGQNPKPILNADNFYLPVILVPSINKNLRDLGFKIDFIQNLENFCYPLYENKEIKKINWLGIETTRYEQVKIATFQLYKVSACCGEDKKVK